mgnify:CR=1 FL=1
MFVQSSCRYLAMLMSKLFRHIQMKSDMMLAY